MPIDPSTAFVSYAREDLEFVLRLAKDLKAKGAKVWMDKLDTGRDSVGSMRSRLL